MSRLKVLKTYKMYVGGKFIRTESGRFYALKDKKGKPVANFCLGSRKDVRNTVVAARKAQSGWQERTAFNRSQILYRIAEMLEAQRDQFIAELQQEGHSAKKASALVDIAVDRWVYYAGWCDKYSAVFSSVNPVATGHFNFSQPEAQGVVAVLAPKGPSLVVLTSLIAPVIASGNSVMYLAHEDFPLSACSFAEVINSSDVPGGVINILTGKVDELASHMAGHMDINGLWYALDDTQQLAELQKIGAENVKRIYSDLPAKDWEDESWESPYLMVPFTETKTTWHPIENIGGASSTY
ncbi:aldehyde dehydrogenase family protein [bacterium SCSIO 12741]|nr:aldehyde dehydrogenase family protein [bacterium SCSIO 12741]